MNNPKRKPLRLTKSFDCEQHTIPPPRVCIELAKKYGELPVEEEYEWLYKEK